jgi:hypothetical protein
MVAYHQQGALGNPLLALHPHLRLEKAKQELRQRPRVGEPASLQELIQHHPGSHRHPAQ